MTLEEAVAVLNRERHNGSGDWREDAFHATSGVGCLLTEFEAIAIAEKYERERLPEAMPERRTSLVGVFYEQKQSFRVPTREVK